MLAYEDLSVECYVGKLFMCDVEYFNLMRSSIGNAG
jgi:hypothetical protein